MRAMTGCGAPLRERRGGRSRWIPAIIVRALRAAGKLAWERADYAHASTLLEQALAVARDNADQENIAPRAAQPRCCGREAGTR
ncbi:MAG: hypothetical protein KatS3mg059_0270 [Thermomicrobiales bacterium]|nr:MAG: hypothetical protein KatS3mg059_0270 [Thermomicrobiales bacterium]